MNAPCPPLSPCVPCPHPPIEPNQSGPDVPGIACWIPEDCCLPSPCSIDLEDFLCAIRSLLPQGDIYNNTRAWAKDPPVNVGVMLIGCARIGCEQLIFGGCCEDRIFCDDEPVAPQLAVVDSFSVVAYGVMLALCKALREFDACTSEMLRDRWAKRMGLLTDNACDPKWSDNVLMQLMCILPTLKGQVMNWQFLNALAARFGADITLRMAGDFSDCAPSGWWTMARDRNDCPPIAYCPPETPPPYRMIEPTPQCVSLPESYNLVVCEGPIRFPVNCNLANSGAVLPHDPELYSAFKWLLPKILPQPIFWCVYQCSPEDCIV